MPPELLESPDFFETPGRTERFQLLLHLARNAAEPVYLRGPAGAGKTRLTELLDAALADDFAVVRLDLAEPVRPVAALLQQLKLAPDAADEWPRQLFAALGDRQLLVIVDTADVLDDSTRQPLLPLQKGGARILLVGRGEGAGTWPMQFVDLPPFSVAESASFLKRVADGSGTPITDDLATALHAASGGWPGGLLNGLRERSVEEAAPNMAANAEPAPSAEVIELETEPTNSPTEPTPVRSTGPQKTTERSPARGGPQPMDADKVLRRGVVGPWAWVGGVALAIVLVAVLVFQDPINRLIAPAEPDRVAAPIPLPDAEATADDGVTIADEPVLPAGEMPSISLPELSEAGANEGSDRPGQVSDVPVNDAVESLMPGIESLNEELSEAPTATPSASESASGDDLLDAVMADALEAQDQPPGGQDGAQAERAAPAVAEQLPATAEQPVASAAETPKPGQPTVEPAVAPAVEAPAVSSGQPPAIPDVAPAVAESPPGPADVPVTGAAESAKPVPGSERQTPAPVEDRTAAVAAVSRPIPRSDSIDRAAAPAPVEERGSGGTVASRTQDPDGNGWLSARDPNHYTLQVVGARDRESVEKFVQLHNILPPFAIFSRQMKGAPWFSLVVGDYPDRDAAVAARDRLPRSLAGSGVWPRTFASIQAQR